LLNPDTIFIIGNLIFNREYVREPVVYRNPEKGFYFPDYFISRNHSIEKENHP